MIMSLPLRNPLITVTEMELEVGFSDVLDLLDNELPITWSSSNPAIVTVDKNGIVVGKKKGTAIITGLAGGVKYICKVTVVGNSSNGGNNGSTGGNGNNNSNGSNNGNTGNNGSSNGSNSGNNGNGSNGSSTGGNTGGSTGGNTTVNKPSTVTPDSEAEVKRYDWNEISDDFWEMHELIHGKKMQIIIDNAPDDLKMSLGNGVLVLFLLIKTE